MYPRRVAVLLCIAVGIVVAGHSALGESGLEALARGDAIALIRHANAPGTGDPPSMQIDDCATQRNLDAAGRAEASALGARLRQAGIAQALVYSSRWCRTRETATLLAIGDVTSNRVLDSFFGARQLEAAQTAALIAFLAELPADTPIILVTHQVNITALTGVMPAPAEIVLIDRRAPHAVRARLR